MKPSYRRGGGSPRRAAHPGKRRPELLLFVEGAQTEEMYFVDWARRERQRVHIRVADFHGSPFQLVQRAADHKRSETRREAGGKGRAPDQIWCVFDVDEHPRIPDALAMAAANDISVAVTNPCFELWLILHFADQTAYLDRHEAQRVSTALLGCGKALSGSALQLLSMEVDEAVRRSSLLDLKHSGDGSPVHSNPSSGIGPLIEVIRTVTLAA